MRFIFQYWYFRSHTRTDITPHANINNKYVSESNYMSAITNHHKLEGMFRVDWWLCWEPQLCSSHASVCLDVKSVLTVYQNKTGLTGSNRLAWTDSTQEEEAGIQCSFFCILHLYQLQRNPRQNYSYLILQNVPLLI